MDLQKMMDSFSAGIRNTRADYHLTLGNLIKVLEGVSNKEKLVKFSSGENVGAEDSYRGYYSDLHFEVGEKEKTVNEFLVQAKNALDGTYTGYKGGDYVMDEDTPLWKAEYGSCGEAIVGHHDGEVFTLVCKDVE
jgi:hypothetical protein